MIYQIHDIYSVNSRIVSFRLVNCVMKSSPGLPLGYPFKSQPELFAVGRKEEREMESEGEGEEELTV